jgi:hypothetical protein
MNLQKLIGFHVRSQLRPRLVQRIFIGKVKETEMEEMNGGRPFGTEETTIPFHWNTVARYWFHGNERIHSGLLFSLPSLKPEATCGNNGGLSFSNGRLVGVSSGKFLKSKLFSATICFLAYVCFPGHEHGAERTRPAALTDVLRRSPKAVTSQSAALIGLVARHGLAERREGATKES